MQIKREGETLTGRCGSPAWTAPELLSVDVGKDEGKRKREADERSDVYSLGMVMWEVATRSLPYAVDRPLVDVALAIVDGRRPPLPYEPASLSDETWMQGRGGRKEAIKKEFSSLIEACWRQDPDERPTAEWLLDQLDQLIDSDECRFSSVI